MNKEVFNQYVLLKAFEVISLVLSNTPYDTLKFLSERNASSYL